MLNQRKDNEHRTTTTPVGWMGNRRLSNCGTPDSASPVSERSGSGKQTKVLNVERGPLIGWEPQKCEQLAWCWRHMTIDEGRDSSYETKAAPSWSTNARVAALTLRAEDERWRCGGPHKRQVVKVEVLLAIELPSSPCTNQWG
jgi:hypothetical protein